MIFSSRFRVYSLLACLVAAGGICASAYADEAETVDKTSALEKLQGFTNRASELALNALGLLGIRYRYGGDSPESGLDCSGLVRYVFKQAWDRDLPRTTREISQVGSKVATKDLQPGDLVFYNTLRRSFSHVGIYLGGDKFIHAPSSGGEVRIEDMKSDYWQKRFNGARRIEDSGQH